MKLILSLILLSPWTAHAQTFQTLKVGNSAPINVSAVLEVQSTSKAMLLPRMTTSQKNAIATPTNGDLVYDSTINAFSGYQNGSWSTLGGVVAWGSITGTLSSQTDLQNVLNLKANLASPTFTGTITAPTFIGALTGNASTATALAANPTDCTSGQYATTIAANGNLSCAVVQFTQLGGSGVIPLANGGTNNGALVATAGGVLYTDGTKMVNSGAGTAGQVFTSNGASAPSFQTSTGSPIGTVVMFAAATAPTGWLLCDGSAVSRSTYSALFGIVGTTFGSGDGSTTFNLPDTRGIFVRGSGSSGKLSNASGTAFSGTLGAYQNDEFQSHQHGIPAGATGTGTNALAQSAVMTFNNTTDSYFADGGAGTPRNGLETNPANISLNYIIKY